MNPIASQSIGMVWDTRKKQVEGFVEAFVNVSSLAGMTGAVAKQGRRVLAIGCALLGALSLTVAAGTAHAQDFYDPESVAWKFRYGLSDAAYSAAWEEYKEDGYLPIDIEMDKAGSTYSGVWQKNTDGRDWVSWRRLSDEQFHAKWDEYRNKGYLPIDQDAEVIGGKLQYSLIMVENKEGLKWISNRNLTSEQFSANFAANKGKYKPIDIDAIEVGGTMRYSIIWIEDKSNQAWVELRDMTPDTYGEKFEEYHKKGYRVADLDCYQRNGNLTYAAIWEKNTPGRAWAALRQMSAQALANNWKKYADQGMRVIDIEICPAKSGGATEYAAVWRQNDDRFDWAHKNDIDKAVKTYQKKNGVPGMSVAVAENGKIVYARGFGHADIKNNKEAHAGTIYRAASVSKGITALLALRLLEKNELDLDKKSRVYAPSLPAHHTHTVRQLLQHKSGVRHYKGSNRGDVCPIPTTDTWKDSSTRQYKTATQAATLFQNDPLMFTPNAKGCYSTHGYTIAAATLEGASNKSYTQLVGDELSKRLKLSTLQPEDISQSVSERSKIYSSETKEVMPDIIAWKHAGGGLEVSVTDLAKLGMAVNNGTAVKVATRKELWKGSSFSHSGGQRGAASYWRIYFNSNKAIAILSNRQIGSPGELADEIAGYIK